MAAASSGLSTSGKLFFGSLCAGTFGLGCWQTQRYFEKIDLVEQRARDLALDPRPLEKDDEEQHAAPAASSGSLQRRIVRGTYRHGQEILVGPRGPPPGAMALTGPNSGRSGGGMASSPQGYFVVTPLDRGDGGTTVLVNRGWIPRHLVDDTSQQSSWDRPVETVQVVGVPSKPEKPRFMTPEHDFSKKPLKMFWMDQGAMERVAGVERATLLAQIQSSSSSDSFPVQPPLETVGEFKTTPAIHAGYAATWFGLSAAGILMTKKLMTRGRA